MSEEEKEEKSFLKLKCVDCGNEQITFRHASSNVDCQICGARLAEPTGGQAKLHGEIVEELGVEEEVE